MNETARNSLIGLFVVLSLVVLAVLLSWFGEAPDWLGGNEWNLRIVGVHELRGVQPGSPVRLGGVDIGRVKTLEFVDLDSPDKGVVIVTGIRDKYLIPSGATARVYGATLGIGTGHIEIQVDPAAVGPPLSKEDAAIRGEMRSIVNEIVTKEMVGSVERMIRNIGDFADAATPVASNLANLLERRTVADVSAPGAAERGMTANLATVVERLDNLTANLNAVFGDVNVQTDVRGVVSDMKATSADLKETAATWKRSSEAIAGKLETGLDDAQRNLDQSFSQLHRLLDRLDDGATHLASITQTINDGRGSVGKLVHDDRLYEAGVLSLERLADAISELKTILGKIERDGYVTIGQAPIPLLRARFPLAKEEGAKEGEE
ncbi:MAG: MlaD family protein [Planctomycetota bacterium]